MLKNSFILKKTYLLLVALILLLFLLFRVFIVDGVTSKDEKYAPISGHQGKYVGDKSCISCHGKEHKQWSSSHHYMSMLLPTPETVKGDFNNVVFTADGVTSRFFKKGTKYFINTEGDDGKNHDFEVKYVFGFTPLQQYLIEFPGGRMQVPRLSWDTQKKKWFNQYAGQKIASHDWLHWTGNSQNWNTMCASCHSTNLQKNYNTTTDSYKTTYDVINVSCESCHGAGEKHLDYIKGADYKDGERIKGSFLKLVRNSGQLEQINTCAPCHARVSEINSKHIASTELLDNYIPQIPDDEFYYADGQIKDEDYIYTSFLQSKMFSKGVKCSNCHDIHTTKLKKTGNQSCTQCHLDSKYNVPTHTFHKADAKGSLCISCHMLGKFYMGNDFRHDHSFRVPRPDLTVKYGTPNACNICHTNLSAKAMAQAVEKWYGKKRAYHFAEDLIPGSQLNGMSEEHLLRLINGKNIPPIIRATAAFYLGKVNTPNSLNALLVCIKSKDAQVRYRAIQSLVGFTPNLWVNEVGPLLKDKVRAVRIAAADMYTSLPKEQIPSNYLNDYNSANKELLEYLHYQTDFSVGNVMLADYYLKVNDYENAKAFYLKGIKKDSQMNYALLNLATVYNMQGNNQEALATLEKAIKNDAKNDRAYFNLGLLYNEMKNSKASEEAFAKAVSLQSKNDKLYYNYGLLLLELKKFKEAESILKKGIEIAPFSSQLYYALTFVYMQANLPNKALETVVALKKLDGNNPNYQSLFAQFGV